MLRCSETLATGTLKRQTDGWMLTDKWTDKSNRWMDFHKIKGGRNRKGKAFVANMPLR